MHRFLQNLHAPDSAAALAAWLQAPRDENCRCYAIADMSILEARALRSLERLSAPSAPLLDGSRYAAYGELGPRLVPLVDFDASAMARFIGIADGLPALSFVEIETSNGMPDRATLLWLADARTSDGLHLYCRFPDTRVLVSVLRVLDRAQIARLGQSVRRWAWLGRDGKFQCRDFTGVTAEELAGGGAAIEFSDEQFAALVQAAECDLLYQQLLELAPELIPDSTAFEIFARLEALLNLARGYGLTEPPDQLQFVTIAWSSSERFHELDSLSPTWTATRSGSKSFSMAVAEWSDGQWDEIESIASRPTDPASLKAQFPNA